MTKNKLINFRISQELYDKVKNSGIEVSKELRQYLRDKCKDNNNVKTIKEDNVKT